MAIKSNKNQKKYLQSFCRYSVLTLLACPLICPKSFATEPGHNFSDHVHIETRASAQKSSSSNNLPPAVKKQLLKKMLKEKQKQENEKKERQSKNYIYEESNKNQNAGKKLWGQ